MNIRLIAILLIVPAVAQAGLHYSGETYAPLPARSGGFLMDHRALLNVARPKPASPLRLRYRAEADRLAAKKTRSTDEAADLGALYLRLGETAQALAILRPAQQAHPRHFRLTANRATAHHLAGELALAAACLEEAIKLASPADRAAEQAHLRLVRGRLRGTPPGPDHLFDAKKPPAEALAQVQQLSLWLPSDGLLLWQLAELVGANGEPTTRAALLEGCVSEFQMRQPELLAARKAARADAPRAEARPATRAEHDDHARRFVLRSPRPLLQRAALEKLPPIRATGVNALPWEVITETTVDRRNRPTFYRYLRDLEGKQVTMRGQMQPVGDNLTATVFLLIESPVGCWYCENPDLARIVLLELPEGRTARLQRGGVVVTGKLELNNRDPEAFFYTLKDAKIVPLADE